MNPRYKAVLFDFDGTIMDTNEIIINSWRHTFRAITGEEDVPVSQLTPHFGETLETIMGYYFPGRDSQAMVEVYRQYQRQLNDKDIYMFDGVEDVMKALHGAGVKLGVVTSRLWESTMNRFYHFPVRDILSAAVSASDTKIHKPEPEPCLICLEKLGVDAKDALFVGDSRFDIMCAHNAGVDACAVNWSICFPREMRAGLAKPDYEIDRPEELLGIVLEGRG